MIPATWGGTISSQLSSPLAIRWRRSREKIGRYFGLKLSSCKAAATYQRVIEGLQVGFHLKDVDAVQLIALLTPQGIDLELLVLKT
jgi:hypothetical protein